MATQAAAAAVPDEVSPLDGTVVFGRYRVTPGDDEAAEVELRSPHDGTAWCDCLEFQLSEDARCSHVRALDGWLRGDGQRAAALAAGREHSGSRVALLHGARRRLFWLPGRECPPALAEAADEVLGVPPERLADDAVPLLLRRARALRHPLHVDEAVFAHLAARQDRAARVQRLEALARDGGLDALLQPPGLDAVFRPHAVHQAPAPALSLQAEAALFAVCAGRAILADAPALQPLVAARLAVTLWQRHFGIRRVLVLAPDDALAAWRETLSGPAVDSGGAADGTDATLATVAVMSIDKVAADSALHAELSPELVVVHEATDGGLWIDADRATALLRLSAPHAVVLPQPGWLQQPAEVPLRVAFVDADRLGPYAAFLDRFAERDAHAQLCGVRGLTDEDAREDLRDTLAPVLLMRGVHEVHDRLPLAQPELLPVELPAAHRLRHRQALQGLAGRLARHARLAWWPAAAQRDTVAQVHDLQRGCAGAGLAGAEGGAAAAKARALQRWLQRAAEERPDGNKARPKAVVFAQWVDALDALQAALGELGLRAERFDPAWAASAAASASAASLTRFAQDPSCPVLLAADADAAALSLAAGAVGAVGAGSETWAVVHLDQPFAERALQARFDALHGARRARLVPVLYLVLRDSFEAALHAARAAARAEPGSRADEALRHLGDLLDADALQPYLPVEQGAAALVALAGLVEAALADGQRPSAARFGAASAPAAQSGAATTTVATASRA